MPEHSIATSAAADPGRRDGELRAMMDAYYGASVPAVLAGALGALLLAALLRPVLPGAGLPAWLAVALGLFGLRLAMMRRYRRAGSGGLDLALWRRRAWLLTALQGLCWGSLAALVGLLQAPLDQMLVLVSLLVLAAGSAVLAGTMPTVVPVFGVMALLPAIVGLLWQGTPAHLFLAYACAMFLVTVNVVLPRTVQGLIRRAHGAAVEREQLLARLQDAEQMALLGHFVWEVAAGKVALSAQAARMLGVLPGESLAPADIMAAVAPEDRDRVADLIREALRRRLPELRYEARVVTPLGAFHIQAVQRVDYAARGRALRVMTTVQDITRQVEAQRELGALAFGDPLTGLPNRAAFQARLQAVVAAPGEPAALLLLDLDHFKSVNDTLGHEAGDRLLVEAAARLRACLASGQHIARLGGDEFAIVLPALPDSAVAAALAQRLIEVLVRPFQLGTSEVYVSASIGIAMYPADAAEAESLLRCADVAMFDAKAQGRSGYQFHCAEQSLRARERVLLEADLRRAIERDEFLLHYQPKVALEGARVVGAEALLRWCPRGRGDLSPERFIPVAEDSGLIVPIGEWVLRSACATARDWNLARPPGAPALRIAVNLSPRQVWSPDFIARVRAVLHDTGCRAEWIELEMTEGLLIDSRGQVAAVLAELRRLGFSLAIDDFGTGYSALGYLTRFPISTLKIDRSFVADLIGRPERAGIVRAVVGMGRSLGLELVAEGVEEAAQAEALRLMGCHLAQGWLYGRPLPRQDFERVHAPALAPATHPAGDVLRV
ncbi:MAG: EAL domain-containing protein [Burkholderiaceae bacterium]|nr:EAL domain-containing protein [Burkholderiaceae bacterium]